MKECKFMLALPALEPFTFIELLVVTVIVTVLAACPGCGQNQAQSGKAEAAFGWTPMCRIVFDPKCQPVRMGKWIGIGC
jgi:hypothetical protein